MKERKKPRLRQWNCLTLFSKGEDRKEETDRESSSVSFIFRVYSEGRVSSLAALPPEMKGISVKGKEFTSL